MCKIIQFPVRESNGYKNLIALFDICESIESCNFYLASVEELYENGSITEREMYTLRRVGRTKRLALAKPATQKAETPSKTGVYSYTPEMGQEKPECQMEASRAYYGGHYFVDTPLELKGRGITPVDTCWTKGCKKQIENWKCYRVTRKAFEKLQEQYTISMEVLLD